MIIVLWSWSPSLQYHHDINFQWQSFFLSLSPLISRFLPLHFVWFPQLHLMFSFLYLFFFLLILLFMSSFHPSSPFFSYLYLFIYFLLSHSFFQFPTFPSPFPYLNFYLRNLPFSLLRSFRIFEVVEYVWLCISEFERLVVGWSNTFTTLGFRYQHT